MPNSLIRQAMIDKQDQMAALGARLLQPGSVAQTAYETASDDATAHSVLSIICDNVSDAYTKALRWAGDMMGTSGTEISFAIPTDFASTKLDAPTLTALFAMVQAGKLPESDLWAQLRGSGYIDPEKDDAAIREELDAQGTNNVPLVEPGTPPPSSKVGA